MGDFPFVVTANNCSSTLGDNEIKLYREKGYSFPHRVLTDDEITYYREKLECFESEQGLIMNSPFSNKPHLAFTWAYELIHNPNILGLAESILGPNLLVWGTNFWIKEAKDPAYVSWHQDSTYWGLSSPEVMTVWVALSDSNPKNGVMRVIANSHLKKQINHVDTFAKHNLLTRGQEVATQINERDAIDLSLKAGEVSLHHVNIVHGSAPNSSNVRRIGLAIRIIPTHVKQIAGPRDFATLVLGEDNYHHFEHEKQPVTDLGKEEIKEHRMVNEIHKTILYRRTNSSN